jgi:hypothetical protein
VLLVAAADPDLDASVALGVAGAPAADVGAAGEAELCTGVGLGVGEPVVGAGVPGVGVGEPAGGLGEELVGLGEGLVGVGEGLVGLGLGEVVRTVGLGVARRVDDAVEVGDGSPDGMGLPTRRLSPAFDWSPVRNRIGSTYAPSRITSKCR